MINATMGMTINWLNAPTENARGNFKTLEKSATVRPSPSVNMINVRMAGNTI
jgi:hypothetical protein